MLGSKHAVMARAAFIITVAALSVVFARPRASSRDTADASVMPPPGLELPREIIRALALGREHVYDDLLNVWVAQVVMNEKDEVDPDFKGVAALIETAAGRDLPF